MFWSWVGVGFTSVVLCDRLSRIQIGKVDFLLRRDLKIIRNTVDGLSNFL